jgi:hypothetical protein
MIAVAITEILGIFNKSVEIIHIGKYRTKSAL